MAVPEENLAAQIINQQEAGFVVSPTDIQALIEAAENLYINKEYRERFARNGRLYAETHFDIQRITDKFQFLLA